MQFRHQLIWYIHHFIYLHQIIDNDLMQIDQVHPASIFVIAIKVKTITDDLIM